MSHKESNRRLFRVFVSTVIVTRVGHGCRTKDLWQEVLLRGLLLRAPEEPSYRLIFGPRPFYILFGVCMTRSFLHEFLSTPVQLSSVLKGSPWMPGLGPVKVRSFIHYYHYLMFDMLFYF